MGGNGLRASRLGPLFSLGSAHCSRSAERTGAAAQEASAAAGGAPSPPAPCAPSTLDVESAARRRAAWYRTAQRSMPSRARLPAAS